MGSQTLVVKLGGSTLGSHDTTMEDLVTLQERGVRVVVVHGGGKLVSEWIEKQGAKPSFVKGLRVTDPETLKVVTAVLAGLVNKELVATIQKRGGRAIGISCVDGGLIEAEVKDPSLGLVGEVAKINPEPLKALLSSGYIPVVAPLCLLREPVDGALLANVNGDVVAGALACAIGAGKLVFLTDVPGIYDSEGKVLPRLTAAEARRLITTGVAVGGMLPKLESCLKALSAVGAVRVVDGRVAHALLAEVEGAAAGTTVTR